MNTSRSNIVCKKSLKLKRVDLTQKGKKALLNYWLKYIAIPYTFINFDI